MARVRVSTTVDGELLAQARGLRRKATDGALIDEALTALVARYRSAEIDEAHRAYDDQPPEESDEWGGLASFHETAVQA